MCKTKQMQNPMLKYTPRCDTNFFRLGHLVLRALVANLVVPPFLIDHVVVDKVSIVPMLFKDRVVVERCKSLRVTGKQSG